MGRKNEQPRKNFYKAEGSANLALNRLQCILVDILADEWHQCLERKQADEQTAKQ